MQYSFYGGQQGKNFEIAKIFHNKVELMQDLMKRWQSSIGIGELVLISYGLPSDQSYQTNRDHDKDVWGVTYNVSLWQKIYTEESSPEAKSQALLKALREKEEYKKYFEEHDGQWPKEYWDEYYALGGVETQYIINGLDKVEADYAAAIKQANGDPKKEQEAEDKYYQDFKEVIKDREYVSEDFGLGYKLIASLIGTTPVLDIDFGYLDANQEPDAWISFTDDNLERPVLHFRSPQAQEILPGNVSTIRLDAGEDPEVKFDNTGTYEDKDGNIIQKANKPTIEFKMPRSQKISPEHVSTTKLDVDEDPQVVFNVEGEYENEYEKDGTKVKKINQPSLGFRLPQSQKILSEHVSVVWKDADAIDKEDTDPDKAGVVFDNEGEYEDEYEADGITKIKKINQPSILFKLPRNEHIQLGDTTPLPPQSPPIVNLDRDTDVNNPSLTIQVPRAVRFIYGNNLGFRNAETYTLDITDAPEIEQLDLGDYYIQNEQTRGDINGDGLEDVLGAGFIYLVVGKTDTTRTFKYQASLATPAPEISSAGVQTYEERDGVFEVKDPVIRSAWSNTDEKIGQVLSFEFPRLPNLKGSVSFVGPDELGQIDGNPTDVEEFTYSFTIPSGARFYCGSEVNDNALTTVVAGARPGDFYINGVFENPDDGKLYKLGIDKVWVYQGSIKGNEGNPLNITHDFIIEPGEVDEAGITMPTEDTLDAITPYLVSKLGAAPDGHEIIAVTYRAPADGGGTIDTAYWYYVADGKWGRAQLTGATASLIENGYKAVGDTNKAYSVTYINGLLVALGTALTAEEKTRKTYSVEAIEELLTWGSFADL